MKLFRNPAALLPAIMMLSALLGQKSDAALTVVFSQNGPDVVVTASGTLDLNGLNWTDRVEEATGEPILIRQIAGNLPQDIVRLLSTSFQMYRMPIATNFFNGQFGVQVATQSSGQTFGIWSDGAETCLYVPARFTAGSLSGSMVFENVDLASLGLIEQDVDFGASEDKRVSLRVIPEASSFVIFGLGGAGFAFRRSRGRNG